MNKNSQHLLWAYGWTKKMLIKLLMRIILVSIMVLSLPSIEIDVRVPSIVLEKNKNMCSMNDTYIVVGGNYFGISNHLLFELLQYTQLMRIGHPISYVGFFLREDWKDSIYNGVGKFVKYTKYITVNYNHYRLLNNPLVSCEIKSVKQPIQQIAIDKPSYIDINYNEFESPQLIKSFLKSLRFRERITRKVKEILKRLGVFIAFHNRVEDDWRDSNKHLFIDNYIRVERTYKELSDIKIFIAGASKIKNNSYFYKEDFIKPIDNIEGAMIDMLVCSKSKRFYGVLSSTFSLVISYLRDDNNHLFGWDHVFWNDQLNKSYISSELSYTFYKVH